MQAVCVSAPDSGLARAVCCQPSGVGREVGYGGEYLGRPLGRQRWPAREMDAARCWLNRGNHADTRFETQGSRAAKPRVTRLLVHQRLSLPCAIRPTQISYRRCKRRQSFCQGGSRNPSMAIDEKAASPTQVTVRQASWGERASTAHRCRAMSRGPWLVDGYPHPNVYVTLGSARATARPGGKTCPLYRL